jgi:hypothetical protein
MFGFIFFFLFLIVFLIIAIGGTIIRGIFNLLFGRRMPFGHQTTQGPHGPSQTHSHRSNTNSKSQSASSKKREKIFDDSEGEYVDFEELDE